MNAQKPPFLGFGLGLRPQHYPEILDGGPRSTGSRSSRRTSWSPAAGRCTCLEPRARATIRWCCTACRCRSARSIRSTATTSRRSRALADRVEPAWISDHLCWTGVGGHNVHDLLPLPYTEEALAHVVERVGRVQDALGRRIVLENVSSYVTFCALRADRVGVPRRGRRARRLRHPARRQQRLRQRLQPRLRRAGFLAACRASACGSSTSPATATKGTHLIDTHDHPVVTEVWALYREAVRRFGPVPTMIERDDNIPPLAELVAELDEARRIAREVLCAPRLAAAE